MTIYCPSCGKPNTDQAEKCASCGKELEKAKPASPKFKGTMMMGAATPKPPGPGGGPASPGGGEPPQGAGPSEGKQDEAGAAGTPGESQAEPNKNLAFQRTMMGPMAPPGGGGGADAAGGGPGAPTPPAGPAGPGAPGGGAPEKPKIPKPPPPSAGPPSSPSSPGSTPAPQGEAAGSSPPPGQSPPSTAGSGFGAPPEGAAAGPAPGAAPSFGPGGNQEQAQAGAGGQAAGGWGAPAGGAPPAGGGGWGGGAPAPQPGAAPSAGGVNKKVILWVAIGCAALLVLACGIGIAAMVFIGNKAEEGASSFAAQASRVGLGFTLSGIQSSCQTGGADAASAYFHPKAFAELKPEACTLNNKALEVFADANKSEVRVLSDTDLEDRAEDLGVDPDTCYLYEAGDARIAGCELDDGFKIIHMENLGSL